MKKTLAAVAVLGAFAGSALAADVTLYGKVDLGVRYTHADSGKTDTDNFAMDSGLSSASRWGIKGSEQISEGLTVGFQLESGFNADNGDDQEDKLFRRESRLYVATDYGTLHMGRFGALDAATGSLDMVAGFSASGTGYGEYVGDQGEVFKTNSRMDNSIAYTSPEFAGMKVAAMVSFGTDGKDAYIKTNEDGTATVMPAEEWGKGEGSSDVDRYYGLGVKGQWGALGAGLVVSQMDKGHEQSGDNKDDILNVTAGVNYDFGVAKTFLAANYYDDGEVAGDKPTDKSGWGVSASVAAPVASGTFEFAVAYGVETDDKVETGDDEWKKLNIGAFYKYPLSKRTYVYTGVGYDQDEKYGADKVKTTEVISGICHNF